MRWAIVYCVGVLLAWALVAGRLGRWRITAPMVMVFGGMIIGLAGLVVQAGAVVGGGEQLPETVDLAIVTTVLNNPLAERIAELILALVLFVDSFEIRRGVFGHEPALAARLLALALPASLLLGYALGLFLFPHLAPAVVLVLVCAVMPTDLGPAAGVLRDERLPERVRNVLNVESGYNDGFVAPVFVFALTLAGSTSHASSPQHALEEALPASLNAIGVGAAVGGIAGLLMRVSAARDLTTTHALRFGVVCIPLLTYALAALAHGNGFVAAFVAGIAFRAARGEVAHREVGLSEDVAALTSYVMWFVLGVCAVLVIGLTSWQAWVFGLAALTVLRIVPVLGALLGSTLSWSDRWLVALLGPRGTATIVFALLAFYEFAGEEEQMLALSTMTVAVIGSFLLHGLGSGFVAERYARRAARPGPVEKASTTVATD